MKTARKLLSLLLVLVMCLCMFTACGENSDTDTLSKKNDDETTTSTTKDNGGGLLGDLAGDEVDPAEKPYDAIVRAWALTAQDVSDTYLAMFRDIPTILGGTATYEASVDVLGTKADLTAIINPEKLNASVDVSLSAQGIDTEASLWLGDDIAISVPDLLGNKAYGIKLSTLMNDLDNSWILSMLDVSSADQLLDMILSESGISADDLSQLESVFDELSKIEKELTDAVKDFADELADYVKDLDTEVTEDGDSTVIATAVTSDDVADLVVILADVLDSMMDGFLGDLIGSELNTDDLRDSADSFRGEPGELVIIHTLTEEGKLQQFDLGFVEDDSQQEMAQVVFNNGDAFGFDVFVEGTSVLRFKSLDGKAEGFEITVTEEDASILFERNKSNGDFTLDMQSHGETVAAAKGNLQYGKGTFAIELDSITADGETMEIGVKLSMKAGGKVKALPNYKNVLTMSQNELQALLTDVQDSPLMDLM